MKVCTQCGKGEVKSQRGIICPACVTLNKSEGAKRGIAARKELDAAQVREGVKRKKEEWREGSRKPQYGYFGLYGFMKLDANGAATV